MATATEPNKPLPKSQTRAAKPLLSGFIGAVLIAGGSFAATYFIPTNWKNSVSPQIASLGSFLDSILLIIVQIAVILGVVWLGSKILSSAPPKGTRGAIGLILAFGIGLFFIGRAIGLNLEEWQFGLPVTVVLCGAMLGLSFRFLNGENGRAWMVALEEQGWFSTFSYKPNQGRRARLWTLIAFLLIGFSGILSIENQRVFTGDWTLKIPFTDTVFTALTDLRYTGVIFIAALTLWLSWRAVNMPQFADFLIATEAEMTKVAWSKRKRLIQDTIVVLIFVIVITLFLMIVDLFWGWLLSARYIEVLPGRSDATQQTIGANEARGERW